MQCDMQAISCGWLRRHNFWRIKKALFLALVVSTCGQKTWSTSSQLLSFSLLACVIIHFVCRLQCQIGCLGFDLYLIFLYLYV